jgi:hypothetical protein
MDYDSCTFHQMAHPCEVCAEQSTNAQEWQEFLARIEQARSLDEMALMMRGKVDELTARGVLPCPVNHAS